MLSPDNIPTTACMAKDCAKPAAGHFILCWDHWSLVPMKLRERAWAARLNWRAAIAPDARAVALRKLLEAGGDALHAANAAQINSAAAIGSEKNE